MTKVEALNAAIVSNTSPDRATAEWVGDLEAAPYDKLAAVGLVPERAVAGRTTLRAFLDNYIASRTDIKPTTRAHLERAKQSLVTYFGADRLITAITPGDADEFRLQLLACMADNTVRRICGRAKQFFRVAERKGIISHSSPARR